MSQMSQMNLRDGGIYWIQIKMRTWGGKYKDRVCLGRYLGSGSDDGWLLIELAEHAQSTEPDEIATVIVLSEELVRPEMVERQ